MAAGAASDDGTGVVAKLDMLRSRVMAVVGHELRTPVTTLRGLADQLKAASADEIRDEIAPAMARLAGRVEQLLDDLLVAADLSTVMPVGRARPAPITHAVYVAWAELGHGDELTVEDETGARAIVPPATLPRLLAPLLDNAAKYGDGRVAVHVTREPGTVTVEVASGGPAVSSIDLALAFEPFYRGERAVTATAGLGVGLPVCRTLVEQVGGTVAIAPGAKGGVIATVTLPGQ